MTRAVVVSSLALAVAALCAVPGCRTVEGLTTKPEVRSVSVVITELDLRGMTLRLDVELNNPGDGELTIAGYDYALQLEGRPFLAGQSRERVQLLPRGTARAPVPVELVWADLQTRLAMLKGRGDTAYALALSLLVETPVGTIRVPLNQEGCLPLFPMGSKSCRSTH
jgi:LEA14-like dessication related protein